MKMYAVMSGEGKITFGQLKALVAQSDIPDTAEIDFHSSNSQRDGAAWSFRATWERR